MATVKMVVLLWDKTTRWIKYYTLSTHTHIEIEDLS